MDSTHQSKEDSSVSQKRKSGVRWLLGLVLRSQKTKAVTFSALSLDHKMAAVAPVIITSFKAAPPKKAEKA